MKRGRGRPLGFRLSEESKRAISAAKTGQKHSEETKDKISRTLMKYFRDIYPLSKELYEDYSDIINNDTNIKEWFDNISSVLDSTTNVLTEKSLNSKRMREITIEYNIDMSNNCNLNFFTSDPEKMCELKLICEKFGLSVKELLTALEKEEDAQKGIY